jgi:hypothetical protein
MGDNLVASPSRGLVALSFADHSVPKRPEARLVGPEVEDRAGPEAEED